MDALGLFPSPCGVLVLKDLENTIKAELKKLFPSPCGVLVLKEHTHICYLRIRKGFRPLAGFWFLK